MSIKYQEPSAPIIWVSEADIQHHMKYIGRVNGFKNEDGTPRVPSPEEVMERGWEPKSYLDQFKSV